MNSPISSQTVVGFMSVSGPIISFLSAIAPVILAVLTGFYLWETRKMRKEKWRPHVSFEILPRPGKAYLLDVVIKNHGMGPAYDISFQFDPEIPYGTPGPYKTLGSLPFLQKMEYLAPNSEKNFFFNTFMEVKNKNYPMEFSVEVKYKDWFGKLQSESFQVDLSRLEYIGHIQERDIAEELEKIRKEFGELLRRIKK